jgi:hypothetical protein
MREKKQEFRPRLRLCRAAQLPLTTHKVRDSNYNSFAAQIELGKEHRRHFRAASI